MEEKQEASSTNKIQRTRTQNSALTLVTGSVRQILWILLNFVSRTVFIHTLGADYLGLNGLFSNILSILALSELGIGSAIQFYLYKPIADQDEDCILALMNFYKKCYRYVGLAMLGIGSAIMPLLPKLVKFDQGLPVNLYLVYFLFLFNTCSTYLFFAYKQIIATASQEQFRIEKYNVIFNFISCATDIVVLLIFRAYIPYLIGKIVITIVKNATIASRLNKIYPFLTKKTSKSVTTNETKDIFNNVLKVAVFKFGSTLYNSTDNIMISIILGTVIVGYYSNYYLLTSQLAIVINLIVQSVAAGIGNVIAKDSKKKQYEMFKELDFMLFVISSFITICAFQLFNSFIKLWIGGVDSSYVLSQWTVFFICISFYFDSTTQILDQFRVGSGNFNTGKWLQLIGGGANIILDIVLGNIFGLEGIFAATVLTKGLITVVPFAYGIGKNVLNKDGFLLVKEYGIHMIAMLVCMALVWLICHPLHMGSLLQFIFELILTVGVVCAYFLIVYHKNSEFKALKNRALALVHRK